MVKECTLQVFIDGIWRDAAGLALVGDEASGIGAPTFLSYGADYTLAHLQRQDAAALSVNHKIDLVVASSATWPPFLIDLLPQGHGRKELLHQLGRDENAGPAADWALLCAGSGNPIGNVRVKEAYDWAMMRTNGPGRGFTMEEISQRAEDFNEYLAQHGLFLAGSSGIQGEWPKVLLTRARDGLFYLDHALPDEQAEQHYIVKFGRGTDHALANILRCEGAYMQLARQLGLRVHDDLVLRGRALFIPRFDRKVVDGRVQRYAQESVASVCQLSKFGEVPSHNDFLSRLASFATDMPQETIEYVKRDIANVVLGNTDNHARNTAIQRRDDGYIGLTPVFDFAPMFLHPDGMARRMRWIRDDGGAPHWSGVIDQAAQLGGIDAAALRAAVKEMIEPLSSLMDEAYALGIGELIEPKRRTVENNLSQLKAL
ncbi:type II toxin-antitoxin system HipA family toxin [Duganella sp. FT80W]|uniref:Type II toxin-antitoxin system HipA family toxin n=1 Tax=Duganella guangzhouensis TaxID=2666084 RepID=A0A6I2KY42_9BURK|nr:HipA domain-containing protein [Duganella guangzhouensis]MRW89116.1 type II toxin-antitoxin system HipA family toxin [Duganella guangzhouensis]